MTFFVFVTTFCIELTQTEKKNTTLTDNYIYYRIWEFKANNEIIIETESQQCRQKNGEWNAFMSIMFMTKIMLHMWMWGPFHNKSGVNVSWENVLTNKCIKSCDKANYFHLKTKPHWKGNVQKFWLHSVIFFTKVDLYNADFRSLFLQINRVWELFFLSVGSYFPCRLLCLQR